MFILYSNTGRIYFVASKEDLYDQCFLICLYRCVRHVLYKGCMHSGMRAKIEEEIKVKMEENLTGQADGIELIAVSMKN